MELREALYTTRAMRRVSDRAIPEDVQARILDAAVRAPSGGNAQNWRFLIVDDPAVKASSVPCTASAWTCCGPDRTAPRIAAAEADPDSEESRQFFRVKSSAQHLADHFEHYPLLLFAFSSTTLRAGRSTRRSGMRCCAAPGKALATRSRPC